MDTGVLVQLSVQHRLADALHPISPATDARFQAGEHLLFCLLLPDSRFIFIEKTFGPSKPVLTSGEQSYNYSVTKSRN